MSARSTAFQIVRRLQANGFESYWVGGCVRDMLLGRDPTDFDIATAATPEQVENLFPHTVPVGKQFGIILVVDDGISSQVATFRSDGRYQDGRRPDQVTFSTAQADAGRRDFTINGLFFDPIRDQLWDWVGGKPDLAARLVRTIGAAEERFAEDRLRLLRAVRFAAQLDFDVAPGTLAALRANAANISGVSAERVRDELLKLFRPPHAAAGLDWLRRSELLLHVLPEIAATLTCTQSPDYHPEGTVYNHLIKMLGHLPENAPETLPWAVLLHDIAKPQTASTDPVTGRIHFFGHERLGAEMAEALLRRLRFPRHQIDEIVTCVRHHMQFKDVPQMRKSTLRRLLLRPTFPLELELHRLDCLGSHGGLEIYESLLREREDFLRRPEIVPPLLTGADLIGLGFREGPEIGRILGELREKQLQDELTTPDEARAWVNEQIRR